MSDDSKSKHVISCQSSLDISVVSDFANELKTALESNNAVQLQAAEVAKADTAALQLLCAFFLDAEAHGIDVEWVEPSDELCVAASSIGLTEHLGLENKTLH